jgi:DNA-binding NarL/FixJ family response regulator
MSRGAGFPGTGIHRDAVGLPGPGKTPGRRIFSVNEPRTKIVIVDDHPLVREWLTGLLRQQADFAVGGEAEDAPRALQVIGEVKPDVAIVDISLKDASGIELIKNLKAFQPGLAIVVLSMHDELFYAERALRAGAQGYIMKREATPKIIDGIRQVLAGKLYVSEQLAGLLAQRFVAGRAAGGSPVEQLSDRELEVFQLFGRGFETRQVAAALHVSMKTVQAYCARIKEKLNLANATELIREAVRWQENHPSS